MKSLYSRFVMLLGICVFVVHAQLSDEPSVFAMSAPTPPQPAQAIQALTRVLAGSWRTSETYERTEPTPNGGTGEGEAVWRPGPGGFVLLEEYQSKTPLGELFGFGIVWSDSAKDLQHLWCINVNPTGCEMFPGPPLPGPKWDGTALVLDTEVIVGGKKFQWHETISDFTETSYVLTVDLGDSRSTMKRWLTSRATKVRK